MTTITHPNASVTVGVDTHSDNHVAAALDPLGRLLGTGSFPASGAGYRDLAQWARAFGPIDVAGIEGSGSWGAGLTRHLTKVGVECREVNHPNRQHRRRHGKSDTADAIAAARSVQAGQSTGIPRGNIGLIEALRVNRITHRSAIKARTQAINEIRSIITTAPTALHDTLHGLSITALIQRCANLRPTSKLDATNTTKAELRQLARRVQYLDDEIAETRTRREHLVNAAAPPQLLAEHGIGHSTAADLLITLGDNPTRVTSEASFAALCGVSPVDASSGRQQRHRLNRGGDRQANQALWTITIVRLSSHQPTRDYMTRQLTRGKTKKETIRQIKRYLARHIWRLLQQHPPTLDT